MRVFISIDIPKKIQKEIKKIQEQIPEFKGKLTELENLHLTLKFLGEINQEKVEKIREKLREIKYNAINCKISSIGVFSKIFIKIVWLHLNGCEELQKFVDDKLCEIGFKREKRFMGHLTIARVKSIKNKREFLEKLNKIQIPELNFDINSFKLKKSVLTPNGPKYKVFEEYKLKI